MAGDWIKMRTDLREDPAVFRLADALGIDEFQVVGSLFCFWSWADRHAVDGRVDGATSRLVDKVSGRIGFADALVAVGWLAFDDKGLLIPNFERHNGESAKERGLKNARQARWRAKKDGHVDDEASTQTSTGASTREEKRRTIPPKPPKGEAGQVPCPYEAIVSAYHDALPELPRVRLMTKARERAMRKCWGWVLSSRKPDGSRRAESREEALAWFAAFFGRVRDNDFLMGRIARHGEHAGWQCDLDFLLTDKGLKHVVEKTQRDAA